MYIFITYNYLHACFHNMHVTGNYMHVMKTCKYAKLLQTHKQKMFADDTDGTEWSRGSHLGQNTTVDSSATEIKMEWTDILDIGRP